MDDVVLRAELGGLGRMPVLLWLLLLVVVVASFCSIKNLSKSCLLLFAEVGGDSGHTEAEEEECVESVHVEGDEVEAKGYGWFTTCTAFVDMVVDDDEGEMERFSMECAMLVCELDGRMIETGLVDVDWWWWGCGGGDSEPYLVGEE